MRTPISYYGGKQNLLKEILPLIPPHKIYVEPFSGGASVFWAKGPSKVEVLNDTNRMLVNFYEVLQNNNADLQQMIKATLNSEAQHREAYKIYRNPRGHNKIKRAWAVWMVTNFSYACKIGGGWKFDNGTDGSHNGVNFRNKRVLMLTNQYQERLGSVQISARDANQVIKDRNTPETFLYLDPPYPRTDQGHYKGYTIADLTTTLDLLQDNFKGKFMLSNYDLPELQYYAHRNGWKTKKIGMRCSAPKEMNRRKKEILVMNYELNPQLEF